MANVFLDANVFISLTEGRKDIDPNQFLEHDLYISPLSIHILQYLYKYKMPHKNLNELGKRFFIVNFDEEITVKALTGPTTDFEDNVQLHSAAEANCDFFLTDDKKLLNLKFFGKTQLVSSLGAD